jgi:predicted amidohydrolase YtcJ
MSADLVLRGGRVWAGRGQPRASAVAIAGERVVAVGSDEAVSTSAGSATRVVELGGRLVVPGFNDAHVHLLDGGYGLLSIELRDASDEHELERRLRAHAARQPKGSWILRGNWDHEAWPSKRLPSRGLIDAATPDHPVLLNRLDGHMSLVNSLALRLAGITRETTDPPGGAIVRDASGEPTGILKDRAEELVLCVIPERSRDSHRAAALAALAEAARLGVTSIQDNSVIEALPTYQDIRAEGALTARLNAWRPISALPALKDAGVRSGLGDDWIRLGALKILADGSLGAATAAFFEPYHDHPETRGLLLHPVEELGRLVREADQAGFQLAVHAIGDRANALVLDAFEQAVAANGPRDRRLRIEHAQAVRPADLARYAALGVIASVQPSHCIDDMRWARERLGDSRARDAYRLRSFSEAGVRLCFGSDWYVEPLDPRLNLYAAVTRAPARGTTGSSWFPEERISLEDALDAYTRGSAHAEFASSRKGTLQPGKLADLVVFAGDLFEQPASEILTTPVEMTVVGGRIVYEAGVT